MDTRQEPFGNHPDGGSIKQFESEEKMPKYMLPLSVEATKILDAIPQENRVNYLLNESTEPELEEARNALKDKLAKIQPNYYSDRLARRKRF